MDNYFLTFTTTQKNKKDDVTDFLNFTLKGAVKSLNEIKDKITFFIRKFTLRDFYRYEREAKEITQRQLDLLELLLENHLGTFTLKDLYNLSPFNVLYRTVSERTARRDLQKLSEKGLLLSEKGQFFLNLHVLG
jgi:Fic family protein